MSLAGQISHIVTTLASTREARHAALGRIRNDAARHLREARATQRRTASEQQHRLNEALRSIKLETAILLGTADERIDRYSKARTKQAARIDRALAEGLKALRGDTRKWISTQSAMRRKLNAEDLRQRLRDRKALGIAVHDLTTKNLAFLATLTRDRQEASSIWQGRAKSTSAAASTRHRVSPAKPDTARPDTAKAEAGRAAATVEPAKIHPPLAEGVKAEPVRAGLARAEPAKVEAAKAQLPKTDTRPTDTRPTDTRPTDARPREPAKEPAKGNGPAAAEGDVKSLAPKAAADKPVPGKSM